MSRQWMRIDALFFGSPLAIRLQDEFGWAGPTLWLAFLAGCKRHHPPGRMTFLGDADALAQMGFAGRQLVDDDGKAWELDDFWRLLGRTHTTTRRVRGGVVTVIAREWDEWQTDLRRADDAERQSRSRATKPRDTSRTGRGQMSQREEKRREEKIPPHTPPQGGANEHAPLNDETTEPPSATALVGEPVNLAATVKAALPPKPPPANGRRPTAADGIEATP